MTEVKQEIIELVMTNPHEIHIEDLFWLLDSRYVQEDIRRSVIELHIDDRVLGFGFDFSLFIYDKPPPYAGEG